MPNDHRLTIVLAGRDATKAAFGAVTGRIKTLTGSMVSLTGAAVALGGPAAMGYLVKSSLEVADAIGKAADMIGIQTGALQEYHHAAQLSGVDTNLLDKSFAAFTKRVGEAREGTGPLVTYLKKFDEQLLAGVKSSSSMEQALELVFKRMGRLESAADRAALANAAFSRSGLKLVNMVKNGSDGLAQMREEARRLGLVIGDDLIRNSEAANDQLDKMARVVKSQLTGALVTLAPDIIAVSTNILGWVENNNKLIAQRLPEHLDQARAAAVKLAGGLGDIYDIYQKIPAEVVGVAGVGIVGRILFGGTPAGKLVTGLLALNQVLKSFKMNLGSLVEKYRELNQASQNLWDVMTGKRDASTGELKNGPTIIRKSIVNQPPPGTPSASGGAADPAGASSSAGSPAAVYDQTWGPGEMSRFAQYDVLVRDSQKAYVEMTDHVRDYTDYTSAAYEQINVGLETTFSRSADALADFAASGKLNFKSFADSLVSDLIRIQTRMALTGLFKAVAGAFTPSYAPTHVGAGGTTAFQFHGGGHLGEGVSGVGMQSGRSYEFHANETVIPDSKLAGGSGGGQVNVYVQNYSSEKVKVEQQKNPGGFKEIFVIIAENIANRGPVGRAIESTYGLRRPGRSV